MNKNRIKMMIGIGMAGVIIVGAWNLPGIVYSFYDDNSLNHRETFQLELKQYAKEGSMEEQLESLAMSYGIEKAYNINTVKIQDESQSDNDEELTEIIKKELEKLSTILGIDCRISKEDMISRELYTAYLSADDGKSAREGITLWKVHYQRPKNELQWYDMEVILDMEYQKIYGIRVQSKEIDNLCNEYGHPDYKKIKEKKEEEEGCEFIELMREYYGDADTNQSIGWGTGAVMVYSYEESATYIYEESVTIAEADNGKEANIDKQLNGYFAYGEKSGEEYYLNFIKEYGRENGKGYLYVGVLNFHTMLQI